MDLIFAGEIYCKGRGKTLREDKNRDVAVPYMRETGVEISVMGMSSVIALYQKELENI